MREYLEATRSPLYSVLLALPLLIGYEVLVVLTETRYWAVRNAADVWIRVFLRAFEVSPHLISFVMIGITVALIVPAKMRSPGVSLRFGYIWAMLFEAAIYSLLLGLVIRVVLSPILLAVGGFGDPGVLQALALSLGAGLFEELFFRVILLNLLLFMLRPLIRSELWNALLCVTLASLLFSLSHYVGNMADTFSIYSFLFRWIAGLLFSLLYYMRGFADTAYTHALYDVRVLL